MEELFRSQPGVIDTRVGYTGGKNEHPTYEFHPGHAEAIEITYNSDETDFRHLLDFFFRIHNPTTVDQQGNDVGAAYRSAIFVQSEEERHTAEDMIAVVNDSKRWKDAVVTTIEPFTTFFEAEAYHQDYLQKDPKGYTCHYVRGESYLV